MRHQLGSGSFHAQAEVRRLAVGAPDAEVLDFETAVMLDHGVEDVLHYVGVDQMAFGLDDFLQGHKRFIVDCGPRISLPQGGLKCSTGHYSCWRWQGPRG